MPKEYSKILEIIDGPIEIRTQDLTVISRALHLAKLRALIRFTNYVSEYFNVSLAKGNTNPTISKSTSIGITDIASFQYPHQYLRLPLQNALPQHARNPPTH